MSWLPDVLSLMLSIARLLPTKLEFANSVYLLCWRAPVDYADWAKQKAVSGWWKSKDRLTGALGIWREVVQVQKNRLETIFSSENPVGIAETADGFDLVQEHAYWGSARDRMPISAHDDLVGSADTVLVENANVSSKGKARVGDAAAKYVRHPLRAILGRVR